MLLGLFILYSAFDIGRKNILFLMGSSPPAKVLDEIGDAARSVKGVDATNDIFGHYFGNKVHAEVHINVSNKLTTPEAHEIGKEVQRKVESIPVVSKAFVHIDPERAEKPGKK
ncbi:hypothetical protein D6764_03300 [Candidatus Woesearchaeota archaeon]|nr:MAG: hypothetical protein D6764_03300 [Candidatus Woesearchaeota archaeon]